MANCFSAKQVRTSELLKSCMVRIGEPKGEKMPLILAPIGQEMRIVRISSDEKTKKHLADLGIFVTSKITVLSSNGGSAVCVVKDGRLALDRTIASHIFVA